MKLSLKKGFGFGLTSGIITTLGLIVGMYSGTQSVIAVISSIVIIALADAMSDALGVHISEESDSRKSQKEVWESTFATFISKFFFALTFIIPILLLPLYAAIIVCIIWGLSLIAVFSYYIAKWQNVKAHNVILEHLLIAVFVIIATHYIGKWVAVFI